MAAGGRFLGRTILGDFFDARHGKPRATVLDAGERHFPTFVNMVRPILGGADELQGTASDGRLYLVGAGAPWAILVIVRAAEARHAVLVPVFEDPEKSAYFLHFLESPASVVAIRLAEWKEDHFEVSTRIDRFDWPAANYQAQDG